MVGRKLWEEEEIQKLKKLYPQLGIKETAKVLGRSYFGVAIKANRIGIYIPEETTSKILSTMPRKQSSDCFMWKGGVSLAATRGMTEYQYINFKNIIKKEVSYICQDCGDNFKNKKFYLDIHHKDRNKLNNSRDNIEVLCRRCHMKAERILENLKKRMRFLDENQQHGNG
jgi:DNA-directed RNA polymerase subunit RPC12/RpoP